MSLLCVGDVGLDDYVKRSEVYIGGCAFNVYQSSSLHDKALFCPMGEDSFSAKIKRILTFDPHIYLPIFRGNCSRQEIDLFENGEKNFLQFYPGPWSDWRASKIDLDFMQKFDLGHTVIYEQNVKAVNSYVLQSKNWSMDFMTMKDFHEDASFVETYLPHLRYAFFGLDSNQKKLKADLIKLFAKTKIELIITLGALGSEVYFGGETFTRPAAKVVKVIDSTGAGDAFIGAYLSARMNGLDIFESMRAGSQRASEVIQTISMGSQFKL